MRLFVLIFVFVSLAPSAPQNEPAAGRNEEAPAQAESPRQEPPPPPPPRITRSGGVITIRGRTSQIPAPASESQPSDAPQAEKAAEESQPAQAAQPPRRVSTSTMTLDANGRQRRSDAASVVERTNGDAAGALTIQSPNGRRVPYLTEKTTQLSATPTKKVSRRTIQRYDTAGRPSSQDVVRIEERKLPNGAVERIETSYSQDLNGRLEPVERTIEVVHEKGDVTTTTKQTEKPAINGRFETILQEEKIERKLSETSASSEVVRKASFAGKLQEVEREESSMTKKGAVSETETKVFAREAVSGDIKLASRSVGTLEERPDGGSVERVETYGFRTGGGARNINTSRPTLQEVTEVRTTVQADGTVRERVSVKGLRPADPTEMGPPTVIETVTKPTPDGEQVRTDVYEQGVNGRLRATQSIVQQIEK